MSVDPYYYKTIDYKHKAFEFSFDVANTIFSTYDIDVGTKLLIRTLKLDYSPKDLLDLGCGYGVLGIVFSKILDISDITMVDTNMLSLRYADMNLEKSSISAKVIPSVGFENVPKRKYELIVSNIPAKIGDTAIEQDFILKPLDYLKSGCDYWFVVVSGLNRLIPKLGARHKLNMKQVTKRNRYVVYKVRKGMC